MVYKKLADGRVVPYAFEEQIEQEELTTVPSLQTTSNKATTLDLLQKTKLDSTKEVTDGTI